MDLNLQMGTTYLSQCIDTWGLVKLSELCLCANSPLGKAVPEFWDDLEMRYFAFMDTSQGMTGTFLWIHRVV